MEGWINHIDIQNFKAFKEFTLKIEGRHLLVYGPNGSGKSSLYWALFTFFQSANKQTEAVSSYFDPEHHRNLTNVHEENSQEKPGKISLTIRDADTKKNQRYVISKDIHETYKNPEIVKAELASDFITYRFIFGFSHFRGSEKFDLWPLFEKEILPFCVSPTEGSTTPLEHWKRIESGDPNPKRYRGLAGTYAYQEFNANIQHFSTVLLEVVERISEKAQEFYYQHFSSDDTGKISFRLGITTQPSYDLSDYRFIPPVLELGIQLDRTTIPHPQTFLNEAKMTQLALSIRLAASLVNLHDSSVKLLVLDDLLISLDMSNRMKCVEILLSSTFENYQKIILTHDLGFYREFKRVIDNDHSNWLFLHFDGNAKDKINVRSEKSDIEKAEDYLKGHDLEEAAICLRKAAEATAEKFRRWATGKDLPPGSEFHSLTQKLREARNKLQTQLPVKVFEKVLKETPKDHRDKLVPQMDDDLNNNELSQIDKQKLTSQRKQLRKFLKDSGWDYIEAIKALEDVLKMTDRVLNPAAHWGEPPLYDKELNLAKDAIQKLEKVLSKETALH